MLVQQILKGKITAGIVTLKPGALVSEATEILSTHRIGALVISQDGTSADGILSERDIVRELGKRGVTCMSDTVDNIMTKKIISCSPDETADQVMQKMTDGRFRHMPVMKGGVMVGLISIGDVVKARLSQLAMENDALEGMIKGF